MLFIDPNEEHQILAVTALGRSGHRVDSATTARDGLRLARENRYDAIVIDHKLRDLAGFEVLRALNDLDRNIPKIYVASAGSETVAIRAVERGAAGYLLKTANFFELLPLGVEEQVQKAHLRAETERQREALRASEERYRSLFERARDPVFVVDSTGHFLAFNRALCDLTGYERDELLGRNLFALLVPEPESGRGDGSPWLPGSSESEVIEFGVRRKDGTVVYVEVSTRLVQQGSLVVGIEGIARDITAKRAIQRALQKVHARLAAVANASSDGIVLVDESGATLEANARACEILGVTRDALVGGGGIDGFRSLSERVADPNAWVSMVDRATRDPEAVVTGDVALAGPVARTVAVTSDPIRDAARVVTGRVWILRE